MILASLDPEVWAIQAAPAVSVTVDGALVSHQPDFILVGSGGEVVVDVRTVEQAVTERAALDAIAAALAAPGRRHEVRDPPAQGPVLTAAHQVWAYRHVQVPAAEQVRALQRLRGRAVALAEVADSCLVGDGVAYVLALACQDIVEIDLAGAPVGPGTMVRRRLARPGRALPRPGGNR